jgi:hypothetical protein
MPLFTRLGKKKPAKRGLPSTAPVNGPTPTVGSPPLAGLATGTGPRQAWTRGRAGGGPSGSGPTLGSARTRSAEQHGREHEEEESPYNNFGPGDEQPSRNAYSVPIPSLAIEEAQSEHEEEEDPYNNFEPGEQPSRNAYSVPIPHVADEQAESEHEEEIAYNDVEPGEQPNRNAYSRPVPHLPVEEVEQHEGEHEQAPERQPQRRPAAQLPSLAAKRGPSTSGNSRQHRAFALQKLGQQYVGEATPNTPEGKKNPGEAIGPRLKAIARLFEMRKQVTFSESDRAYLLDIPLDGAWLATDEELVGKVAALHEKILETLRRQDFDVTDQGVALDSSKTPYPLDGKGYPIIGDRSVGYDEDKDAQDKTLVEFRGGQLVRSSTAAKDPGKPVDTGDSVTHFTGPGWEIFVVDQNLNIHMASHKVGNFHHSSLIGGGEVSMAGEMKVAGGKIEIMSNKSGHYLPTEEMLVQFLHFLEKDGVPLDFTVKLLAQGGERTAKQLLDGKVDGVTADPKKTYEVIKTNVVWRSFVEEFGEEEVMAVIEAQGWRAKDGKIVGKDNNEIDKKLVRRLLKQELGGGRRNGKTQAKVQVEQQKLQGGRPVLTDTQWK